MDIREDDLTGSAIRSLLQEHLDHMYAITPPESVHALDVERLRSPDITFWSAWKGSELLGCGALKELDSQQGEIKSMRTVTVHRRRGVAAALLKHMITVAKQRHYETLYIETGAFAEFAAARALYYRYGFEDCGPFADYVEDPNSAFMQKCLV